MAFERAFGRGPEDLARFAETPWGRDLLRLWRPAGQPTCDDGLRLAFRNKTLNFYRRGQAVAKVGFDQGNNPQMDIHVAYVTGKRGLGRHYARLSSNGLHCKTFEGSLSPYKGPDTLACWVAQADEHKVAEKEFVDDLVTHNPQVIDLEMGLSDYRPPSLAQSAKRKSSAPRMDLVTLEDAAGALQIVFWEAKMMGNGGLRCEQGKGKEPPVVGQLQKYTSWLGQGDNRADVIEAYQANCQLLLELHALARCINPQIMTLNPMICRAAKGEACMVDDSPRLIVRDPDADKSWTAKLHDKALEGKRIQVQLVSGKLPETYVLQGPRAWAM